MVRSFSTVSVALSLAVAALLLSACCGGQKKEADPKKATTAAEDFSEKIKRLPLGGPTYHEEAPSNPNTGVPRSFAGYSTLTRPVETRAEPAQFEDEIESITYDKDGSVIRVVYRGRSFDFDPNDFQAPRGRYRLTSGDKLAEGTVIEGDLYKGRIATPLAPEKELKTQTVEYVVDGVTCEGFVAYDPAVKGKRPGVLIVHAWMGLDEHCKTAAKRLAEMGYVGFACDIYGKGVRPADSAAASKEASKYRGDAELFRKRVNGGLARLQKFDQTDMNRCAAMGYCFGGGAALELARSGAAVKGVASFHGALATKKVADKESLRAKVLVMHGADDPFVKPEEVAAFQKEMRDANADWQFVSYGNAVHSFTHKDAGNDNAKGAAYNEKADKRSWEALTAFLAECFAVEKK